MISRIELDREIELTTGMMADAGPEEREYLIGKLAALLWVSGQLRTDARRQAAAAWDQAHDSTQVPQFSAEP